MLIQKGARLVMQGDSITDAGRARPIAEKNGTYGNGYVQAVAGLLMAAYPELGIRVNNAGISGNNTRDLLGRWDEDTMDLNPDWVSIMIGTNDVWRQFDTPLASESHVMLEEYKENYKRLIELTLPHVKGLVLIAPYYMGQWEDDPFRKRILEYAETVKELARTYKLPFAETQSLFDGYFKYWHPHMMSWDLIHPNHTGSMLIAKAFLNAIEFDWKRMENN